LDERRRGGVRQTNVVDDSSSTKRIVTGANSTNTTSIAQRPSGVTADDSNLKVVSLVLTDHHPSITTADGKVKHGISDIDVSTKVRGATPLRLTFDTRPINLFCLPRPCCRSLL